MSNFGILIQSPEVRKVVQENLLQKKFHDALFPKLQFRAEATPENWPTGIGDHQIFTGKGLMTPRQRRLGPNEDPASQVLSFEQWEARLYPYGDSTAIHMPTDAVALASTMAAYANSIGMAGGQSLNSIVRNKIYNTGLSGHSVADGAQGPAATLAVLRLNGFTRARRPDLAAGEPVQFARVSADNPLKITVETTTGSVQRTVTGYTPDTAGDEIGPGTLTIAGGNVTVADRAAVQANDRSTLVRVGGGDTIDAINGSDTLTLAAIRRVVERFRQNNVPEYGDGTFHMHLDPTSEGQIMGDAEFQRFFTGEYKSEEYGSYVIKRAMGVTFYRNNQCPVPETWLGNVDGTFAGQVFTNDDPFAGEVYNASEVKIHRPLLLGAGGTTEYYQGIAGQLSASGMTGKAEMAPSISNDGVSVVMDRIALIYRAPIDKLQQNIDVSWYFRGDHVCRTDSATGGTERYKRWAIIEHGEPA